MKFFTQVLSMLEILQQTEELSMDTFIKDPNFEFKN